MDKGVVYLDANATYGLLPEVAAALREDRWSDALWNPSSIHQPGQRARACIEFTRQQIFSLCKFSVAKGEARPRIIFTSGATEANNQALVALCAGAPQRCTIITSPVEHPSIIEKMKELSAHGVEVHYVMPSIRGGWPQEQIEEMVADAHQRGRHVGISLMHANNELGTIYDTAVVFQKLREQRSSSLLLHSDCAQTFGKISTDALIQAADLITFSGHKLGALSGVGVLVARAGKEVPALLYGGPQELRHRAGTENVLGIATLGVALNVIAQRGLLHDGLREARHYFYHKLKSALPALEVNGEHAQETLLSTFNFYIPQLRAEDAIVALDLQGVCVSYGSACASGKQDVSHVLKAYGYAPERMSSSFRCSFRHDITLSELDRAVDAIVAVSHSVRGVCNF